MAELNQTGFSRDTLPNLYHNSPFGSEYNAVQKAYNPNNKDTYSTRDSRYPAYASVMSDGRIVTDYRPQCSKNISPALQFNTKLWMVNHAEEVMEESRRRQVEWSGASLSMANTVPPPADIVHSNKFYSEVNPTGIKSGIGIERANSKSPALFGTFTYEPTMQEIRNNRKNINVTTSFEGGRNSMRGVF
jgi:hypothetical protein